MAMENQNTVAMGGSGIGSLLANEDLGKFLLRVNLSFLLLFHGAAFMRGTTHILANAASIGMPAWLAWPLAAFGEFVAPILVLLGIYSRVGAFFMAGFMIVALLLVHMGHFFGLQGDAYRLEPQFFFLFSSLAVMFLGSGRWGLRIGGDLN